MCFYKQPAGQMSVIEKKKTNIEGLFRVSGCLIKFLDPHSCCSEFSHGHCFM